MAYIRTGGGGKPSPELLWTNPNPTSAFPAQTVSLDLSSYKTIAIKYRRNNTMDTQGMTFYPMGYTQTSFSTGGYPTQIYCGMGGTTSNIIGMGRLLTISATGIEFGSGKSYTSSGSSTTSTSMAIPLEIYGIKLQIYPDEE